MFTTHLCFKITDCNEYDSNGIVAVDHRLLVNICGAAASGELRQKP